MIDAKSWLEEFGNVHQHLEMALERYEAMESSVTSPRSTALDGMPHSRSSPVDALGNAMVRLESLRKRIDEISIQEQQLYEERDSMIDRIYGRNSAIVQTILRCRYLDLMAWEKINQVVFGSKPDFDERLETYLRRVYYSHQTGLEAIEKILNREEGK